MSAEAVPITPSRFASALADLPISSLYAKYFELSNQIAHLHSSNKQLEDFARDNDDRECYEAVLENRVVVKRFEERISLIRSEVEGRGLLWRPDGEGDGRVVGNGTTGANNGVANGTGDGVTAREESGTTREVGEEDGVFL